MAGQPQIPGVLSFDVTALEISATGGLWEPQMIVQSTEAFSLAARFHANGFVWNWLKAMGATYRVSYFAEGIGRGPSPTERNLGDKIGNLTAADNYGPPETSLTIPAGTLSPGVYRIACVVTFPANPGLTGFFEGLLMQVY